MLGTTSRRSKTVSLAATAAIFLVATHLAGLGPQAAAQPFGTWGIFSPGPDGYLQIPHSPALNPPGQITLEAWISVASDTGCRSIVGKNFRQAWWLGVCNNVLRSYLKGQASVRTMGEIPPNQWTHVAVTYDGVTRRHYINGELAGSWNEPGPLTASASPVRVGSDVEWNFIPDGTLDEVRLWNVARTTQQIRQTINVQQTTPRPGLVAVWGLEGPTDNVGPFDGVFVGDVFGLTLPVAPGCGSSGGPFLCLADRFQVRIEWRAPDDSEGDGTAAPCGTDDSGLFWFFDPDNWEVLVKAVHGCPINDRWWIFSAATTNVFYRMEVMDVTAGVQKIYFNYPGPPAPAVTDTGAFATCP